MDFLTFLKDKWVLLLDVVAALVIFLTDVIKPPYIADSLSDASLNVLGISRYLVLGAVLLLAIPLQLYKKKKHVKGYWIASIICFILSLAFLWSYNNQYRRNTAYNSFTKQRLIIGKTYLAESKLAIDSAERENSTLIVTPAMLLEEYGKPETIWPSQEIEDNARGLVVKYLMIVFCGAVFIILGMQALKCSMDL